jgi:hypothetical protein
MKLRERAYEQNIDGVAGQPVAGDGVAGYALALEDLEAHANGARQDDICRQPISDGRGEDPRQPVVGDFEHHEYDEPDAEDAQRQDEQALQEAFEQSQHPGTITPASMNAGQERGVGTGLLVLLSQKKVSGTGSP